MVDRAGRELDAADRQQEALLRRQGVRDARQVHAVPDRHDGVLEPGRVKTCAVRKVWADITIADCAP
jgi:hypothetical protein